MQCFIQINKNCSTDHLFFAEYNFFSNSRLKMKILHTTIFLYLPVFIECSIMKPSEMLYQVNHDNFMREIAKENRGFDPVEINGEFVTWREYFHQH